MTADPTATDGVATRSLALLVDGHNMIFRAFSSVPHSVTDPEGRPVNGVHGLLAMLLRLVRDRAPRYVAVAFDVPEVPTFRHELFPAYQGQRGPLGGVDAANFAWQVEQAKAALKHIGLMWFCSAGFEADDIVGTLARTLSSKGTPSLIVSNDRDLQQLVQPLVRVLVPGKKPVEVGAVEVKERLGIEPNQIVDWKVLAGDASDNIPGVPGIGDKTAVMLIEQFGTWESVYNNLAEVPPRWRSALERGRTNAELFAKVIKIRDDLVLNMSPEDLEYNPEKLPARAGDLLRELGLRPADGG